MIFDRLYVVYLLILLFVSAAGLARYKHLNKGFQILTILIVCTLVSEATKKIYGKISHNNMPQAHVWAVIEFAFLSLTYYHLIINEKIKKLIIYSTVGMVLLEIVNVFFFEKLTQFPSLILEASHIVYVVYSLLLFNQMLLSPAERSLFKQSLFWFNINVLFYATTMFLNFALMSYFIENKLNALPLAYFAFVINFIFYIVIGISLLIDKKKVQISAVNNG
jgi:hypothetical protein